MRSEFALRKFCRYGDDNEEWYWVTFALNGLCFEIPPQRIHILCPRPCKMKGSFAMFSKWLARCRLCSCDTKIIYILKESKSRYDGIGDTRVSNIERVLYFIYMFFKSKWTNHLCYVHVFICFRSIWNEMIKLRDKHQLLGSFWLHCLSACLQSSCHCRLHMPFPFSSWCCPRSGPIYHLKADKYQEE